MKVVSKKEERCQFYFYGASTILFVLFTGFLSYGIDQYHEKTDAERKLKFYSSEAYKMNDYLKEEKLIKNYENWLETKRN